MNHHLLPLALMLTVATPVAGEPQAVLDLETVPPKAKTLLWSPLFQASWDKLNTMHPGKLEKIVPPNRLMDRLDQFEWDEAEVMPAGGGYAVFAGPATAEFARATSLGIKKQFGVEMAPDRLPGTPGGNAIYGILLRDLAFKKEFFRSRSNALNFTDGLGKRHQVTFFGTIGKLSDRYGTSVRVLEYAEAGKRFILSISTDKVDERLVIYRPLESESFKEAIDHVVAATKAPLAGAYGSVTDGNLHKNDMVKIPYIDLEADTQFTSELGGLRHYRGDPQPSEFVPSIA